MWNVQRGTGQIGKVRKAMADAGELPKFQQQVANLKFSLQIPETVTSFSVAYNAINLNLQNALEEFATPHWDPWRLPFVEEMDSARESQDFAALVAAIDKARAALTEGD